MSDDDDTLDVSSQTQLAPLPPVPINQGPPSIPLSVLLDFVIQKTYQELTIKTQLLPNMSDMDRKVEIVQFAQKTRQLFVRLLAVVKWAKSAGKVDVCTAISCFLSQQCSQFVETADSFYQLSKELLVEARLPAFQIPAAVDVLTLGNYPRLPVCLKTRFIPDDTISNREQAGVLQRLNQVLRYKLIQQAKDLPVEYVIRNGIAEFKVEGEFESTLTLLGETSDVPWTLLNLKILVSDFDIGEGADLVHPLQLHYLHQVVQARIEASPTPITEMYEIVHTFCLSLQLDVLHCQTSKLIYERLNDNISIEEYRGGQRLVVCYWKNQNAAQPGMGGRGVLQNLNYKVVIDIVENTTVVGQTTKNLKICHIPSSDSNLPMLTDYGSLGPSINNRNISGKKSLSIENLLTDTQISRILFRLSQIRERLERLFNQKKNDCGKLKKENNIINNQDQNSMGNISCRLIFGDNSPPCLNIDLFDQTHSDELLIVSINLFTGRFLCSCERLSEKQLLEDLSRILNIGLWNSLKQNIIDIRLNLLVERCKKVIVFMPVSVHDRFTTMNAAVPVLKLFPKHRVVLKLNRYDGFLLIICLSIKLYDPDAINEVNVRYYLCNVQEEPIDPNKSASVIELSSSVRERRIKNEMLCPTPKKQCLHPVDAKIDRVMKDLTHLIDICDQRVPFMMLCDQFSQRGIKYQMIYDENGCGKVAMKVLGFSETAACCSKELTDSLWADTLACTVRLLWDKSRPQYCVEWIFSGIRDSPIADKSCTRTWPAGREWAARCADEFQSTVCCFGRMYRLARRFWRQANESRLPDEVQVLSFTYHKMVISYGPKSSTILLNRMKFLASIQYRCAEKAYYMSLGVADAEKSDEKFDTQLEPKPISRQDNPNTIILPFVLNILNETENLAKVAQILHETCSVLLSLNQLPQIPSPLNNEMLPSGYNAQQQNSNPNTGPFGHTFLILPVSETTFRLMYRWNYCLEVTCLNDGQVALKDGKNLLNTKYAAKCSPIIGLKAFLSLHEKLEDTNANVESTDESLQNNNTEATLCNKRFSGANMSSDSLKASSPSKSLPASELKLFSPDSAVATPSPVAQGIPPSPAGGHMTPASVGPHHYHQQHPTPSPAGGPFSHGPASVVPLSPVAPQSNAGLFTPSPAAPLSNACMLMTPSPAGGGGGGMSSSMGGAGGGASSYQQPASVPALHSQQPPASQSPPANQVQSPLSALNEFAALSADSKLPPSVEYTGSWGDISGPPSAAATPADKTSVSTPNPMTPRGMMLQGKTLQQSQQQQSALQPIRKMNHDLTPSQKPIVIKHSTLMNLCARGQNGEASQLAKFFGTISLYERLCRLYMERTQQQQSGPSN